METGRGELSRAARSLRGHPLLSNQRDSIGIGPSFRLFSLSVQSLNGGPRLSTAPRAKLGHR